VVVAAVRGGRATSLEESHVPTVDMERLSGSAAAKLLDLRAPELHPIFHARILSAAPGNPLALVDLARTATTAGDHERMRPWPRPLRWVWSTPLPPGSATCRQALARPCW
jgi:hypothetical protein